MGDLPFVPRERGSLLWGHDKGKGLERKRKKKEEKKRSVVVLELNKTIRSLSLWEEGVVNC